MPDAGCQVHGADVRRAKGLQLGLGGGGQMKSGPSGPLLLRGVRATSAQSGTTAVTSISTLARSSTSADTSTAVIAAL